MRTLPSRRYGCSFISNSIRIVRSLISQVKLGSPSFHQAPFNFSTSIVCARKIIEPRRRVPSKTVLTRVIREQYHRAKIKNSSGKRPLSAYAAPVEQRPKENESID